MRILFASPMLPYPPDNGNKKTNLDLLKRLVAKGHDVTHLHPVLAEGDSETLHKALGGPIRIAQSKISESDRIRSGIRARVFKPYGAVANSYLDPRDILGLAKESDAAIFDYWVSLDRAPLESLEKPPIIVLKVNDIASKRIRDAKGGSYFKPLKNLIARYYEGLERAAFRRADLLTVFSKDEFARLRAEGFPVVHTPVGVDLKTLSPDRRSGEDAFEASALFAASPNPANYAAIRWFAEKAAPRILDKKPDFRLRVLLKTLDSEFRALFAKHSFLERVGWVDDLNAFYRSAPIAVMPFQSSTGVKIKLIEAMASGKAIVSTRAGASGVEVISGKEIDIADHPHDFADAVLTFLDNAERRAELSRKARAFVQKHHDIEHVFDEFEKRLVSLFERRKQSKRNRRETKKKP